MNIWVTGRRITELRHGMVTFRRLRLCFSDGCVSGGGEWVGGRDVYNERGKYGLHIFPRTISPTIRNLSAFSNGFLEVV